MFQLSRIFPIKKTWHGIPELEEVAPRQKLKQLIVAKAEEYKTATPFPHVVIDGFFEPKVLDSCIREFPSISLNSWHRTNKKREVKLSIENEKDLGRVTRQVLAALNSSRFVAFLEGLTGISGLVADPHYRGGGLHQILPGGRLGIHADFNFYPKLKLYRRLNVIVYLNQNWQESYGGHLELWDKATLKSVKRVLPTFNRMVVFDTSSKSLHGHPEPLTCPEGRSRKSLALYYYTADYPYEDDREPHSTVFYDKNGVVNSVKMEN